MPPHYNATIRHPGINRIDLKGVGESDQLATAMGAIELLEIAITVCSVWIIVSGLLHSFRENR
jgi:hypothetical protein